MRIRIKFFILLFCLIFTGCFPNHAYVQPEFDKKPLPDKIILVTPDISIYECDRKGKTTLKEDWTKFATAASQEYCTKKIPKLNIIPIDETKLISISDEYKDVRALFEAGNQSILNQYFLRRKNDDSMKEKLNYSLGSLEKIFEKTGGDYLLFIYGVDYTASYTDRQLAQMAAGAAVGIALGALTGFALIPIASSGDFVYVSAALVDKNGEIQWSKYIMSKYQILRDKDDVEALMCELFDRYNECPKDYGQKK